MSPPPKKRQEKSSEKTNPIQWTPCLLLPKRRAAWHSYLHPWHDAPSIHALSPSLNWIYNLQHLIQNPRYRSMAATVKNKKKESLPLPNAFLAPRHNSTLSIFFSTKASNEMIMLIYLRLLAGKEQSATHSNHPPAEEPLKSMGGLGKEWYPYCYIRILFLFQPST